MSGLCLFREFIEMSPSDLVTRTLRYASRTDAHGKRVDTIMRTITPETVVLLTMPTSDLAEWNLDAESSAFLLEFAGRVLGRYRKLFPLPARAPSPPQAPPQAPTQAPTMDELWGDMDSIDPQERCSEEVTEVQQRVCKRKRPTTVVG